MKPIYVLLFFMLAAGLMLSGCNTPFDQTVAVIKNDGSTHFDGAYQVSAGSTDSEYCPSWTGFGLLAHCYLYSESYLPNSGTIDNSLNVPIHSYTVGRLQLHGERVLRSWGLDWSDDKGNSVNPSDFQEGIFYTFKKNSDKIHGFDLVQK
ncbi:MAG TPA: hypothetical protein VMR19_02345 [Candidatus Saccharimonadales bacterium]|jgi:hypothetical protein|nr:hypothetical protein [Candidatus Saccharimonadales bacterium]